MHHLAEWWGKLPTWAKVAVPVGAAGIVLLIWHPWSKGGTAQTETAGGAAGGGGGGGGSTTPVEGSYGNPPPVQTGPAPILTTSPTSPTAPTSPTSPSSPGTPVSPPSNISGSGSSPIYTAPTRTEHHQGNRGTPGPGALTRSGAGQPFEPLAPKTIATPSSVSTSHASTVTHPVSPLPTSAFQQAAPGARPQPTQVVRAEETNPATPVSRQTILPATPTSRRAIQTAQNTITVYDPISVKKNTQAIRTANAADRAASQAKAAAKIANAAADATLPSPLMPLTTNPITRRLNIAKLRSAQQAQAKANTAKAKAKAADKAAVKTLPSPLKPIPVATRTTRVDKTAAAPHTPTAPPQVRTAAMMGRR